MKNSQSGHVFVSAVGWLAAILLAVAVLIGVLFAGRELGWWLATDNMKRETKMLNESVGRQDAIQSKITRDVQAVYDLDGYEQTPAIINQREALVDGICLNASKLNLDTNISPTVRNFIIMECEL